MKKHELIRKYEDALRKCQSYGVTISDIRNLDIYRTVQKMKDGGTKVEYCVTRAAGIYGVSAATVWRILRDMESPIIP